ncbi:MAG: sugar phosphate isomerase/epimerase [Phycisphaerales bacterium]|nr:sugar phosphate isomerase/epimerase [Phycisphaerales bacterium]
MTIPIGLQLYSVRHECAKDLHRVLKDVARMGYEGVEFAGYHGRSAEELRSMLDDLGLKCCGTHTRLTTLLGDELEKTIAFNQVLGNQYLIVPGLAEQYTGSVEAWKATAEIFNGIAERLRPVMMRTGYHNHFTEFVPPGGRSGNGGGGERETAWDLFFSNTVPEVIMQLDTGNARHGGGDVTPYLSRYPGRATTVHLKEYKKGAVKDHATLIGEGDIDWPAMLKLCETIGGTKWFIVEQSEQMEPLGAMEAVEICLKRLRGMRGE